MTQFPSFLDLTKITRNSDHVLTTIAIQMDIEQRNWIALGEISLRKEDTSLGARWRLAAYLDNATDFEHDSAYALSLELVGVEFTDVSYGQTRFSGWLKGDGMTETSFDKHFRVPTSSTYDPRKLKAATKCKDCETKHFIVPEGFYQPPPNYDLYNLVRGCRIVVTTGRNNK